MVGMRWIWIAIPLAVVGCGSDDTVGDEQADSSSSAPGSESSSGVSSDPDSSSSESSGGASSSSSESSSSSDASGGSSSESSGSSSESESSGPPESSSSEDTSTGEPPPDGSLDGEYLLAVSIIVDPMHPIQYLATVEQTDELGGGSTLDISLQRLTLDVGSTTSPRLPFGAPIPVVIDVAADGEFELALDDLGIPGPTNPITGGDILASVLLEGNVDMGGQWCGDMSGTITAPLLLDLSGSTFAFTPLEDDELPNPVTAACD